MKSRILLLAALAAGLLAFSACNKEDSPEPQNLDTLEYKTADNYSTDAVEIGEAEANSGGSQKTDGRLGVCAVERVRKDTTESGVVYRLVRIRFNPDVICADGKRRGGAIVIKWLKSATDSLYGVVKTIKTVGYQVNRVKVNFEGTITFTVPVSGNPTRRVVTAGNLVFEDNTTATWSSDRTWTWIAGWTPGTWDPSDDKFSLSGTWTGVNRRGNTFTANIISDLIYDRTCDVNRGTFPVQGVLRITRSGKADRTIDYGTGTCDNTATVTVNGQTTTL